MDVPSTLFSSLNLPSLQRNIPHVPRAFQFQGFGLCFVMVTPFKDLRFWGQPRTRRTRRSIHSSRSFLEWRVGVGRIGLCLTPLDGPGIDHTHPMFFPDGPCQESMAGPERCAGPQGPHRSPPLSPPLTDMTMTSNLVATASEPIATALGGRTPPRKPNSAPHPRSFVKARRPPKTSIDGCTARVNRCGMVRGCHRSWYGGSVAGWVDC